MLELGLGALGGGELNNLSGGIASSLFSQLSTTASLGGVTFAILDSREQAGRRIARFLFPNRPVEEQVFQDFGTKDSAITITGLIIGDDYVIRAKRMQKVLLKGGRLTLVHPWWGHLKVRLLAPAELTFNERQIRLAHFSAQLIRDPDKPKKKGFFGQLEDTVNNVLEEADALMDEAQTAIQSVLSLAALPLTLIGGVQSLISQATCIWNSVTGKAPVSVQNAVAQPQKAAAEGLPASVVASSDYGNQVGTVLAATPVALVGAVASGQKSIIAPVMPETAPDKTVTGQDVVAMLREGAGQIGAVTRQLAGQNSDPAALLVIGTAASGMIISQMAVAWTEMNFPSNQEALMARDMIVAELDSLGNDLERAAQASASRVVLSPQFQAVQRLRMAIIADALERIGSLPHIVSIQNTESRSLWALAYDFAGDRPGDVRGIFEDAFTRNDLMHPALVPAGPVDVLEIPDE